MLLLPKQHPIHRQDYYYYFTSQSGHYQSLLRVAVCIMMDINEDWITGKRYLSLEE